MPVQKSPPPAGKPIEVPPAPARALPGTTGRVKPRKLSRILHEIAQTPPSPERDAAWDEVRREYDL